MGDREKIAERLAALRERTSFLHRSGRKPLDRGWSARNAGCDPEALERAAQYFGLDHTRSVELEVLAHFLADELFGVRKKGRPHGKDFWTEQVLFTLGWRRYELKRNNPSLTETQIAEFVSKEAPFSAAYKNHPEQIRQHLPEARRIYSRFLQKQRYEAWIEYAEYEDHADQDEYE